MQPFTTVFLFTEHATIAIAGNTLLLVAIIVVEALVLRHVYTDHRAHIPITQNIIPVIGVGIIFLLILGLSFGSFVVAYVPLDEAYRTGRAQVVEGRVRVLSTQPATGHAPGDSILIGQVHYTIDYFSNSPGYTQTIAHGGVLTNGQYVRVISHNGVILRIDVPEALPIGPPAPQATFAPLP